MKLSLKIFYVYASLFYSKGCSLWAIGAITSYGPNPIGQGQWQFPRSIVVWVKITDPTHIGQDQGQTVWGQNCLKTTMTVNGQNQCTGIYNPSGDKPSEANFQKPDQDHTV